MKVLGTVLRRKADAEHAAADSAIQQLKDQKILQLTECVEFL